MKFQSIAFIDNTQKMILWHHVVHTEHLNSSALLYKKSEAKASDFVYSLPASPRQHYNFLSGHVRIIPFLRTVLPLVSFYLSENLPQLLKTLIADNVFHPAGILFRLCRVNTQTH